MSEGQLSGHMLFVNELHLVSHIIGAISDYAKASCLLTVCVATATFIASTAPCAKIPQLLLQEGVNADALSAEDYLNSKGETVVRKLDKAGKYQIYCEPHSGAGMKATITVS